MEHENVASVRKIIERVSVFRRMTLWETDAILKLCEYRTFERGELIYKEGRPSDEMLILLQGGAGCDGRLRHGPRPDRARHDDGGDGTAHEESSVGQRRRERAKRWVRPEEGRSRPPLLTQRTSQDESLREPREPALLTSCTSQRNDR